MPITYDQKIDRARDSRGRFISFGKARLSSVFRQQYEPIMLQRKVKDLEKGIIERDKLIKQFEAREVPKKEWIKVEEIVRSIKEESVMNMYIKLHEKLSKKQYSKMIEKIEKKKGDSGRQKKMLQQAFMELETR